MLREAFGAFCCAGRVCRLLREGEGKSWCTVLLWRVSRIACCSTAFDLHASAQFSDHGTPVSAVMCVTAMTLFTFTVKWNHSAGNTSGYATPVPELREERVCATTRVQQWDLSPSCIFL